MIWISRASVRTSAGQVPSIPMIARPSPISTPSPNPKREKYMYLDLLIFKKWLRKHSLVYLIEISWAVKRYVHQIWLLNGCLTHFRTGAWHPLVKINGSLCTRGTYSNGGPDKFEHYILCLLLGSFLQALLDFNDKNDENFGLLSFFDT